MRKRPPPLPKPRWCPACGAILSLQYQVISTVKARPFRRPRHVCTKCGVAVVLHRIQNPSRYRT